MKICIVNEMGLAADYGIGTYVRESAKLISSLGYETCIVNLDHHGMKISKDVSSDGIEVISIPSPKMRYSDFNLEYYRNIVLILRIQISDTDNQYVFFLNYYKHDCIIDPLREYFKNCIIIFSIHFFSWGFVLWGNNDTLKRLLNGEENYALEEHRNRILKGVRYDQILFDKVDIIICLSEYAKSTLEESYTVDLSKVRVLYNGLKDEALFLNESDRISLKRKYHICQEEKILFFAGRVGVIKGVPQMIKAYCKVKEQYPLCHLIIAGDGDLRGCMNAAGEWIREVTFTNHLHKDVLYELYSISDIGIMQSFYEQCSYVGIEMMMHGLPIIGTNSTGLDEMIIEGVTGFKIPILARDNEADIDIDVLKDKILLLLKNDSLRKNMSHNSRDRYNDFYSSKVMGHHMKNIFQSFDLDQEY